MSSNSETSQYEKRRDRIHQNAVPPLLSDLNIATLAATRPPAPFPPNLGEGGAEARLIFMRHAARACGLALSMTTLWYFEFEQIGVPVVCVVHRLVDRPELLHVQRVHHGHRVVAVSPVLIGLRAG